MGGILLLAAMIAIYIIIYWSIAIETYGNKNYGLLGFKEGSDGSTHDLRLMKNTYLSHTPSKNETVNVVQTSFKTNQTYAHQFLKKQNHHAKYSAPPSHHKKSYHKKSDAKPNIGVSQNKKTYHVTQANKKQNPPHKASYLKDKS